MSYPLDLGDALASGLARLEKGLADLASESKLISQKDCSGPVAGACQCSSKSCHPSWCIPVIPWVRVEPSAVEAAVGTVWPELVARADRLDLGAETVAALNAQIRRETGLQGDVVFRDSGAVEHWPEEVGDNSWSNLERQIRELEMDFPDDPPGYFHCMIMSSLAWDGHVPSLGLTTGWLLVAGLRFARGLSIPLPVPDRDEKFLDALDGVRPGLWDMETLRSFWPDRF